MPLLGVEPCEGVAVLPALAMDDERAKLNSSSSWSSSEAGATDAIPSLFFSDHSRRRWSTSDRDGIAARKARMSCVAVV